MHLGQLEQFAPASEVIDDRSLPRAPSVVMSSFQFFTAANCNRCLAPTLRLGLLMLRSAPLK